jgi:tetratricopeptide (TPR) repeat protein
MNPRRKPVYQDTPELEQARAAFIRQDFPKSLRLFEKAVKKQPHNILALTDAARAHGQRYELDQALKFNRHLLKISGKKNHQALFLAGQSLRMSYRPDEALDTLQLAKQADPSHPETRLELAVLFERRHQLENALEEVDHFLGSQPHQPEGLLLRARILRRIGDSTEASSIYQKLTSSNSCSALTQSQAWNEWSHLLDQENDFEQAFHHLLKSKEILQNLPETQQASQRSQQEKEWANHFNASLNPDIIQSWISRSNSPDHRSILLTGCPRSGTTLIEKILDAHPSIVSADELGAFTDYIFPGLLKDHRDEEGFFDATTLENIPAQRLLHQEKRYRHYLEGAIDQQVGDRILVDKNPSITHYIAATLRLWPNNHILYALRDPRDVALSCFFRWLPINSVSVRFNTFEDTCKRTSEELTCWHKLREMIPADRWRETRYEDTIADYTTESARLLKWMDLPWDDTLKNYRSHLQQRGVNSPTYEAVNQPIYKKALDRWKNYETQISKHFPLLESVMEKFNYR